MLPITNHHSDKTRFILNFEDDKRFILNSNMGLRYWIGKDGYHVFGGDYYLTGENDALILTFKVIIAAEIKSYPYTFPLLLLVDDKIDRDIDFHISENGLACTEHAYIANAVAKNGIRICDFIDYYVKKYLMWVLVKKYSPKHQLQEWAHYGEGNVELYKQLLNITQEKKIQLFLINFCNTNKPQRNEPCYCGNGKKLKECHLDAVIFLKSTNKEMIQKDIVLFEPK